MKIAVLTRQQRVNMGIANLLEAGVIGETMSVDEAARIVAMHIQQA